MKSLRVPSKSFRGGLQREKSTRKNMTTGGASCPRHVEPAVARGSHVPNDVSLWSGVVSSPENSQQFADWYTYSHVIHGTALYLILWLVAP